TAAGAVAAGAAGVVLDAAVALARETSLPGSSRLAVAAMDGSETRIVAGRRFVTRPDLPAAAVTDDAPLEAVRTMTGADIHTHLVPLGQDLAIAGPLAHRFVTVGGIAQA